MSATTEQQLTALAAQPTGQSHLIEIGRTFFNSADYSIASATQNLSWEIMYNASEDDVDTDESWQYLFKVQYWDNVSASWVDTTSDTQPLVGHTSAPTSPVDIFSAGLVFSLPGAGVHSIRLVCDTIAFDAADLTISDTFTIKTYMARIKVQYTIP